MKAKENVNVQLVLSALEKESRPLTKKLTDLVVESQSDYETAGNLVKQLKDKVKLAKFKESEIIDPLKMSMKATQALFKPFYDLIDRMEADTKNKMLVYLNKQTEKQKKLENRVDIGNIKVATYLKKTEELSTKNEFSKARKIKVLVIDNIKMVPHEYFLPDEKKIKEALLAGIKVPGCRIEEQNSIAI